MTHNCRDYHALHEALLTWSSRWRDPRPHAGILILDQGERLTARDYVAGILAFLGREAPRLTNLAYNGRRGAAGDAPSRRAAEPRRD